MGHLQQVSFFVAAIFPEHDPGEMIFFYVFTLVFYGLFVIIRNENFVFLLEEIGGFCVLLPISYKPFLIDEAIFQLCTTSCPPSTSKPPSPPLLLSPFHSPPTPITTTPPNH